MIHSYHNDENVKQYTDDLDRMHKVVLQVSIHTPGMGEGGTKLGFPNLFDPRPPCLDTEDPATPKD